ncbi:Serine/Threonine kinase domain protein (macronuclear) [Tetrahymena thermophila SB210]|uniref:Serine/Threonine kinase domain protein n=1 Tax=Tetrahymena thermophila (strain SB210) TaxID=312017 RepID=I7MMY1_TETTS|nr:Serine/Threonine kinase domain protein [Tetrahymena thermophila SB210]EAS07198.1 Serine/Threonine kinase domain protein [Tetrahymena thermophila SB210]|eukprot:XP_001027440.1 Serine/Threonine kinase domain protein [Tetrahymena thermophila SB210]
MELRPDQILNGKYSIIEKIGEGCFGRVYKGINLQQKEYVAIKQVPYQKFRETAKVRELFNSEVKILKAVKNENVVGYVDYFECLEAAFLVLEYCDSGDLEQYLKKRRTIPEPEAIEFFKQILNGFKGLHEVPAVHRDLKVANILIHNKNILKIADLGFGKIIKDNQLGVTVLGTSLTMAPEVLENKKYGLEVDVYSLGVIFYQMLFGVFPYVGRSDPDLLKNIKSLPLNLQPNSIRISENMKDLLRRMICYQREKRIKWHEVYKHPIFLDEGRRANSNNISLAHLQSSKIQIGKNREFYEKDQNRFENIDMLYQQPQMSPQNNQQNINMNNNNGYNNYNNNGFQNQMQQNQGNYNNNNYNSPSNNALYPNIQQNQNKPNNISNEQLQQIKNDARQNQIIKEQINKVAERYLHYRNLYGQLIKAVSQAHSLPNTQINTFVPIFLIQKKLYDMNNKLFLSLDQKINIFKLQYFDQFLASQLYPSCSQLVKDEQMIISLYYQQLRSEVQQILSRMSNANPQLKKEVDSQELTDGYKDLLTQTIVNYQMNLAQERSKFSPADQQTIFIHEVQVLEIVVIDRYQDQIDFDFEQHNIDVLSIPPSKYDEVIDTKVAQLFC